MTHGGAGAVPGAGVRAAGRRSGAAALSRRARPTARPGASSITLEVRLSDARGCASEGLAAGAAQPRTDFRQMYWTLAQLVTHHASNGCNLRPGDLLGSGTVSGPDEGRARLPAGADVAGQGAAHVADGGDRATFLEDGRRGGAGAAGVRRPGAVRIGLGECRGGRGLTRSAVPTVPSWQPCRTRGNTVGATMTRLCHRGNRPGPDHHPGRRSSSRPRRTAQLYIEQPYELYSEENHQTWRGCSSGCRPRWERYANPRFLEGVETLHSIPTRVPRCERHQPVPGAADRLQGQAGQRIRAGRTCSSTACKRREFPTTITVRDGGSLDYLPEPDIFHDIAGHVPMHTDRGFRRRAGQVRRSSPSGRRDAPARSRTRRERIRVLTSNVKGLARFFWFTVEFGLMRERRAPDRAGPGAGLWQRPALELRRTGALRRLARGAAIPGADRVDHQPVFRDPSLPAAAVRDRGLRAPVLPGARSGAAAAMRACWTTSSRASPR